MPSSNVAQNLTGPMINSGQNFLTGQITSVFSGVGVKAGGEIVIGTVDQIQNSVALVSNALQNNVTNIASNTASNAGKLAGLGLGTASSILGSASDISAQIQEAIGELVDFAKNKVTSKVSELITPPTDLIASYTSERFSYYTQDINTDVLKKLMSPGELLHEKNTLEEANKALDKFLGNITEKIGNVTYKVNKFSDDLVKDFNQLSEYMLAGPQWMGKKIEEIKKTSKNNVSYFIDNETKTLIQKRNQFAYSAGDMAAANAANTVRIAVTKATGDQLNAVETAKAQATNKAMSLIQEAIMKVLGLIGG